MSKLILNTWVAVLTLFLVACTNKSSDEQGTEGDEAMVASSVSLSSAEYMAWIENPKNGLIADKTIGDLTFSAFYKPLEYVALQELEIDSSLKEKLPKKIKEYEGMDYFSFRIKSNGEQEELLRKGIRDESEYYSRLEYFSFRMQQDFKLISGTDTADCALFHYERVYGLAPHASFVLGFPKSADTKIRTKQILFEDKTFNMGNIYITISKEKLNDIPKLEI